MRTPERDPVPVACVMARDHLRNKAPPGISPEVNLRFDDIVEVPAATQQQGLFGACLQMAAAALDGAVLLSHTAIVTCRVRADVAAQGLMTPPEIFSRILV